MNAGTLASKSCKKCGVVFKRGASNTVNTDYCANCNVLGWQEEMYNRGCNVIHPGNIGKQCHTIPLKLKDCPKLVVDGTTYRVTNDLLYEDTKYKKTYPTKEEWNKIREYEYRRAGAEERAKAMAKEEEEERTEREKRKVKRQEQKSRELEDIAIRERGLKKKKEIEEAEIREVEKCKKDKLAKEKKVGK